VVEGVSGNAAKSGIKAGDTIIYASSFFGDELWPADKLSFTQTAIQRAPSPVAFVYVSIGGGGSSRGLGRARVSAACLGNNQVQSGFTHALSRKPVSMLCCPSPSLSYYCLL
jgi:hypothetical protein